MNDQREINFKVSGKDVRVILAENGSGTIKTNLLEDDERGDDRLTAAIDTLEWIMLVHASEGVDVRDPAYIKGIETAYDTIFNQLADE